MGAIRYRFRTERPRRWRGWLARGVLYGLLGGAVLAAVAGARRTDSAYDRFLAAQDAYDVLLPNTGEQGLAVLDPEAVAALPQVADSSTLVYGYVEVGTGEAALADPSGRLGRDLNRFDMLEGRAPQAIDEAAVSFPVADRYGLEVGDTISTYPLSDEQRQALGDDLPDGRLTVVGIEASPGEFPPQYPGAGMVHLSPALARSGVLGEPTAIAVRLEHGSADVPAFRRALEELAGDEPFSSILQTEQSGEVERSIHLQALAFWVLAGVLALVAVTIIAQVESRSTHAESEDLPIVAALGATRPQRFTAALAPRIAIGVLASITAVLTAAALSPLAPIGLARIAEPSAGFHVDPLVVLLGAVGVMVLIPLLTVPACWAAARRHAASIGAVGGATTGRHEPLLAPGGRQHLADRRHRGPLRGRDRWRPRFGAGALDRAGRHAGGRGPRGRPHLRRQPAPPADRPPSLRGGVDHPTDQLRLGSRPGSRGRAVARTTRRRGRRRRRDGHPLQGERRGPQRPAPRLGRPHGAAPAAGGPPSRGRPRHRARRPDAPRPRRSRR